MTWIQAFILGMIQGLTEFLPVSSSGHLAIGKHFWTDLPSNDKFFEVYLHGITLLVVVFVLVTGGCVVNTSDVVGGDGSNDK